MRASKMEQPMVKRPSSDTPQVRKQIAWATWIATITAVGSLFVGYAAMKTQTVQNAPYIALEKISTAPNPYQHEEGTHADLDTQVIFKNDGATQAVNLTFTSLGWFSSSTAQTFATSRTRGLHVTEILQITSPWQVMSSSDSLDRDQPTNRFFTGFPRSDETQSATDHLYIEINYDDGFMRPFREHYIARFCIIRLPAGTDIGSAYSWHRSTLEDCLPGYKQLTAGKSGPLRR